ncbi:hypothetical protein [Sporomusa acidovorans]|uniref:SipL SPOCS domain-containing protein n=1 Tax=Sporomusa acidovorans (strain ATCC 49682 / DSM 3132 / Mol) TaxID=1123286 RepID=A0ABZ3JB95_SPOA4|nr:hypothetical protein [Sporomusa acidovorans]OZC13264.1 hypothetical protein SPACI_57590 [Sporomusa acidovorans DSM 3132]SDD98788.1 hypothetical protein SAMN04488499_100691 [Sporomusa acidovorans]
MRNHTDNDHIIIGSATVLVNVGETPLALIGTIKKITVLEHLERKDDTEKVIVLGTVNVREREEFLIMDVTNAILPEDFPLTIAQLTAGDVAIQLDFVILILPVEVACS